jgi:O-acetyl-ADP-ribose deacetylase (regulator of RNase III)
MPIIVKQGDLTTINCDAVVNPANSYGYMGGGVAGAIKRVGGIEIEAEAINHAPIKVGSAVATTAGSLPCNYVIHAPTMTKPAMRIGVENVKQATFAALKLAEKLTISSIAIPGMGTGVGGVLPKDAAKAIVKIVKKFENSFESIILIDRNSEMVKCFKSFF